MTNQKFNRSGRIKTQIYQLMAQAPIYNYQTFKKLQKEATVKAYHLNQPTVSDHPKRQQNQDCCNGCAELYRDFREPHPDRSAH